MLTQRPSASPLDYKKIMVNNRSLNIRSIIIIFFILILLYCEKPNPTDVSTHGDNNEEIEYPPDIVFISTRDSSYSSHNELGIRCEVYGMDITGQNQKRLTFHKCSDNRSPILSPDGLKIVFSDDNVYVNLYNLFIMNPDGSAPTQLTAGSYADYFPKVQPQN